MSLIQADLRNMGSRLQAVEGTTVTLAQDTKALQERVVELQTVTANLEAKLDDFEERSRRNNVQILGVPERAEGPSADLFVEDLILKQLQPRCLSNMCTVEKAHRVPCGEAASMGPTETYPGPFSKLQRLGCGAPDGQSGPTSRSGKCENILLSGLYPESTKAEKLLSWGRRDSLLCMAGLRGEGMVVGCWGGRGSPRWVRFYYYY